jgi:hypothetical protein
VCAYCTQCYTAVARLHTLCIRTPCCWPYMSRCIACSVHQFFCVPDKACGTHSMRIVLHHCTIQQSYAAYCSCTSGSCSGEHERQRSTTVAPTTTGALRRPFCLLLFLVLLYEMLMSLLVVSSPNSYCLCSIHLTTHHITLLLY